MPLGIVTLDFFSAVDAKDEALLLVVCMLLRVAASAA